MPRVDFLRGPIWPRDNLFSSLMGIQSLIFAVREVDLSNQNNLKAIINPSWAEVLVLLDVLSMGCTHKLIGNSLWQYYNCKMLPILFRFFSS